MTEKQHNLKAKVMGMVPFETGDLFPWPEAHWQSDWNGDEVGYDRSEIVGLYSYFGKDYYVDMETERVLEYLNYEEEDEEWS